VDGAEADKNGIPVRVPASEALPAHNLRSVLVEAVGQEVAVPQAPGQGNKAEAEVSKLVLAQAPGQGNKAEAEGNLDRVLNLRGPGEEARSVVTRVAAVHARTAPAVLRAVLAAVEVEVVVPGVALVAVEVVEVEVAEVVGVRAGAGAVVGVNAEVQSGDQAQE
jgi:hypothetical protein